jgi:hypothetical protein
MELEGLTVACLVLSCVSSESTLVTLSTPRANVIRFDLGLVDERIIAGITSQQVRTWTTIGHSGTQWDTFCMAHNIDQYV